jgi:hypothetical protein
VRIQKNCQKDKACYVDAGRVTNETLPSSRQVPNARLERASKPQ